MSQAALRVFRAPQVRLLLALTLLAMALRVPRAVVGDTWFNLVLGREIARGGLISRNDLTEQGFGVRCVDLQWLAHLAYYELAVHWSLASLASVALLVVAASFAAACLFALSHGASPGRVLVVGLVALSVVMSQTMASARTLTLPLVVLFVCVLSRDVRVPRWSTFALVPAGALWANLHGSVLMAPTMGLLVLGGRVVDRWRQGEGVSRCMLVRDAALVAGLVGACFASPYATGMPFYYRATLGNPALRTYISEWQSPGIADSEVFLLVAAVVYLVARTVQTVGAFEGGLLALLAASSLLSVRHALPLALVSAALLPRCADLALGTSLRIESDRWLRRGSRVLLPLALLAFGAIPFQAARAIDRDFSSEFADRVAAAAGQERVLADELHADRLLWFRPDLKGRVSHDARLESLSPQFLQALSLAYVSPDLPATREFLDGYRIVVVDRAEHPILYRSMSHSSQWTMFISDRYASGFVRAGVVSPTSSL